MTTRDDGPLHASATGAHDCGVCSDCTPLNQGVPTDDVAVKSDEDLPEFGELQCCVLLVHFEDTEPRASPAEFEQFLFGDEPAIGRETESVSDYWEEVSYGQLSLTSGPEGVGGWYEVPVTESEYESADKEYELLWEESVNAAKDAGFDFGAYDNPMLMVYRAGGDGPAWGGPNGNYSGVSFEGSTLCWTQSSISSQSIGVSCHELGHALGLPHAYNEGLDDLALMSGPGTWSTPPSALCAHEKNNIGPDGWIGWDGRSDWTGTTDIWLGADEPLSQPLIVPPASAVDENYRIWDGPRDDGSRYQIEYRTGGGVDRNLNSKGLAVYYYPASSDFEHPLGGTTVFPDGQTFGTAGADIRHPNAETEFELAGLDTAYGCVLCNDPPERSTPASSTRVRAIPIDLDDLPDGTTINGDGDTQIDARVAWESDSDEVTLELVAPDGTTHAESTIKNGTFGVVRSDELSDSASEGGWKLRETVAGEGSVSYVQAITHPSYEMATTTTVREATFDGETLTATVELAFGDGSAYDPGGFGQPTADQFDVTVAGQSVDPGNLSVDSQGSGTYTLTVGGVAPADGDDLAVSFTDQKAGASHTTDVGSASIESSAELAVSAPDVTLQQGKTVEIPVDATAATEVQITDLWTDWEVSETAAAGGSVEDAVDTAGSCRFTWSQQQVSVAPSITFSIPDRYAGGEYALTVTASNGGDAVEQTVTITVE